MDNKHDEGCRCKYVDRWLDAHEKYFYPPPTAQKVSSQGDFFGKPLPFVPNNTTNAYAMLQRAIPVTQPKAQSNNLKQETNAVRQETNAVRKETNAVRAKIAQPNGVQLNPARPFAVVPPYEVYRPDLEQSRAVVQHVLHKHTVQSHEMQPHEVQSHAVPSRARQFINNQSNVVQRNSEQQSMYKARPDLVVQPPHRISPLKVKKTLYVHHV